MNVEEFLNNYKKLNAKLKKAQRKQMKIGEKIYVVYSIIFICYLIFYELSPFLGFNNKMLTNIFIILFVVFLILLIVCLVIAKATRNEEWYSNYSKDRMLQTLQLLNKYGWQINGHNDNNIEDSVSKLIDALKEKQKMSNFNYFGSLFKMASLLSPLVLQIINIINDRLDVLNDLSLLLQVFLLFVIILICVFATYPAWTILFNKMRNWDYYEYDQLIDDLQNVRLFLINNKNNYDILKLYERCGHKLK